jgi:hypothetical protein
MDSYPRITRRERRLVEPPLAATDRRGETGTLMGTNYREFYVGYPEQTTQPESSELSTKIREFISSMISFPNSKKRRSGVPSSSQLPRCVKTPASLPKTPLPSNYRLEPRAVKLHRRPRLKKLPRGGKKRPIFAWPRGYIFVPSGTAAS